MKKCLKLSPKWSIVRGLGNIELENGSGQGMRTVSDSLKTLHFIQNESYLYIEVCVTLGLLVVDL